MRVSSASLYETTVADMTNTQSRLFNIQRQISTGRKMLTAADDPVGAARVLDVSQTDAMNTQFARNRLDARGSVSFSENTMQSVTNLLLEVRTNALSAGSASPNARLSLAKDFQGRLQELMGLANSTDESGNYLFAGYQTKVTPFVDTPAGVAYFGDDGQRAIQVSQARQMDATQSGADIFMRIKSGNGTFDIQPAVTNTGAAGASVGSVVNPAALTADSYSVDFTVVAGVTTYSVTNTTTATNVIPAGTPYTSGQVISFDGIQFDIKGAPNDLDSFSITPSTNESIFKTMNDLATALSSPVVGSNLTNAIQRAIRHIDHAMENVMGVRATLGLQLNELDSLDELGGDAELQHKQTLSELQDTDYAKASADLSQQNIILQAAQLSFAKVSQLSLFDYIR